MPQQDFTPALGFAVLTPAYDAAIGLLTRERLWRTRLVELVDPQPGDRILDVGCGTGSLAIALSLREPGCSVIGLDPDPRVLQIAERKASRRKVVVDWKCGFLRREAVAEIAGVTKIVCSLVFHQTPMIEKCRILAAMHALLQSGGLLAVADYGLQGTRLMRFFFRATVQTIDGVSDTQPNADGCLHRLIKEAGFTGVAELDRIQTSTGSISIYKGVAA